MREREGGVRERVNEGKRELGELAWRERVGRERKRVGEWEKKKDKVGRESK